MMAANRDDHTKNFALTLAEGGGCGLADVLSEVANAVDAWPTRLLRDGGGDTARFRL